MAREKSELARSITRRISDKGFVTEDDEKVSIVEFATDDALHAMEFPLQTP